MAQTLAETPGSKYDVLIRSITDTKAPAHFLKATRPQVLGDALVKMDALLNIVRSAPGRNDSNRPAYDSAVKTWKSEDGAIAALETSIAQGLKQLSTMAKSKSDFGTTSSNIEAVGKLLYGIQSEQAMSSTRYVKCDAIVVLNLITVYQGIVNEDLGPAKPGGPSRVAGSTDQPIMNIKMYDLGPIHLLSDKNDEMMVATGGDPGPVFNATCGGQALGQAILYEMAEGYATLVNHPNDLGAQTAAAAKLYEQLSKISPDKEIWSRENFKSAMAYLKSGNLKDGLAQLAQEVSFNAAYQSLNNLYTMTINQRAVAIMNAGVTVRYEFDKNMEAFKEFMRNGRQGKFEPRFLWLAIGMQYQHLALSGQLTKYQIQAGEPQALNKKAVKGSGDVFGVTPQVGLGVSAWGDPWEIVLHCNAGYRQWELGSNIQMDDGTSQPLSISDKSAFIGIWGAEVRRPGKEGQRWMVRIQSFGAGAVGMPTNPLAYITAAGTWYEGGKLRLQSTITPQYKYFLEQHRPGFEARPLDFSIQAHPEWNVSAGPVIRYEYNVGNKIHTAEFGGSVGVHYKKGIALDLNAGYLMERGGNAAERLPGTPYGNINLTLTPALWFQPSPDTGKAVPKKK